MKPIQLPKALFDKIKNAGYTKVTLETSRDRFFVYLIGGRENFCDLEQEIKEWAEREYNFSNCSDYHGYNITYDFEAGEIYVTEWCYSYETHPMGTYPLDKS